MTTTPPVTLLQDPTSERTVHVRPRAPRMTGLSGRRIALLDISKPRGDVFHDRLEELLTERGAVVSRYRKPTFTKAGARTPARGDRELQRSSDRGPR